MDKALSKQEERDMLRRQFLHGIAIVAAGLSTESFSAPEIMAVNNGYRELIVSGGLGVLARPLRDHVHHINTARRYERSPTAHCKLDLARADALVLLARAAHDLGKDHLASHCLRQAEVAALPVDRDMALYARGMRSLYLSAHDPISALAMLTNNLRGLRSVTEAWLALVSAEALSHARKDPSEAIETAYTQMDKLAGEQLPWMTWLGPDNVPGYEAAAMLRLNKPIEARRMLEHLLNVVDEQSNRRPILLTDLAKAHLLMAEPAAACACANRALDIIDVRGSAAKLNRLLDLRPLLDQFITTDTRELNDRMFAAALEL